MTSSDSAAASAAGFSPAFWDGFSASPGGAFSGGNVRRTHFSAFSGSSRDELLATTFHGY